jgi:hypothetical protein
MALFFLGLLLGSLAGLLALAEHHAWLKAHHATYRSAHTGRFTAYRLLRWS